MTKKYQVYTAYNKFGDVLYVGMSGRVALRLASHERNSPWFDQVRRLNVSEPMTHKQASNLEVELIKLLVPKFNIQHSPAGKKTATILARVNSEDKRKAMAWAKSQGTTISKLIHDRLEEMASEYRKRCENSEEPTQ